MFENENVFQMINHRAVPPPHPCRAGRPLLAVRWRLSKSAPMDNCDDDGKCPRNSGGPHVDGNDICCGVVAGFFVMNDFGPMVAQRVMAQAVLRHSKICDCQHHDLMLRNNYAKAW